MPNPKGGAPSPKKQSLEDESLETIMDFDSSRSKDSQSDNL